MRRPPGTKRRSKPASVAAALVALLCVAGCTEEASPPPGDATVSVVSSPAFPLGKTSDFAWRSPTSPNEVLLLATEEPVHLPGPVSAICPVPALDYQLADDTPLRFGFLVFHGEGVRYLGSFLGQDLSVVSGGDLAIEGSLATVRAATPVQPHLSDTGEVVALITGGEARPSASSGDEGEPPPWVSGANVQLAWLHGESLVVGKADLAETNPWMLRAGRFAGEDNVLIGVYTRAPFDDVPRRRPWIFRIVAGEDGLPHLDPRWRGTSFSRPFRDATFGDFSGSGEGEIAALEVTRDGGRALTAYHFEGFGLEGLGESADLPPVGDTLEAAQWVGDDRDELILRAEDGRFLFFGLDAEAEALREALVVDGPPDVLGWAVTSASNGEPGELTCVLADGGVWQANSWEFTSSQERQE